MRVAIIQQPEKPFPKRILGFRVSFVVFGVVIIQQDIARQEIKFFAWKPPAYCLSTANVPKNTLVPSTFPNNMPIMRNMQNEKTISSISCKPKQYTFRSFSFIMLASTIYATILSLNILEHLNFLWCYRLMSQNT